MATVKAVRDIPPPSSKNVTAVNPDASPETRADITAGQTDGTESTSESNDSGGVNSPSNMRCSADKRNTVGQIGNNAGSTASQINHEIDAILARKISSTDLDPERRLRKKLSTLMAVEEAPTWRDVGEFDVLKRTKCRRLYSKLGQNKDLALFYKSGKFYAMEAWCSHMGGPLYEGDIEDYKGTCHIMCPWHAYMFELETGVSDIGLRQQVFPVKVEDGHVYIEYISPLALYPFL